MAKRLRKFNADGIVVTIGGYLYGIYEDMNIYEVTEIIGGEEYPNDFEFYSLYSVNVGSRIKFEFT